MLDNQDLNSTSVKMTAVGDQWREFALLAVKAIRKKKGTHINFTAIREKLNNVADAEAEVYRELLEICR